VRILILHGFKQMGDKLYRTVDPGPGSIVKDHYGRKYRVRRDGSVIRL